MKKLILYLKTENDQLKESRGGNFDGQQGHNAPRTDNDNIINNLMDKVNQLTEEKDRLQGQVRHLKDMSTLADKSPQDKQLWILKRQNAAIMEEKKGLEDRINQLQREILEKNLKIEELSKKLGINFNFKPPVYTPTGQPSQPTHPLRTDPNPPLHRNMTWADKLKQVFT